MDINNELLTIKQAQDYIKCSGVFLWKRRKENAIKSVNAGRKVLIVKSSIDKYLKLNQQEVTNGQ